MRDILEGNQHIDIIINNKMINEENQIMAGGCDNFKNMNYTIDNRESMFGVLINNQKILDNAKHKLLLKQNIIGLLKDDTTAGIHYLYNDLFGGINGPIKLIITLI